MLSVPCMNEQNVLCIEPQSCDRTPPGYDIYLPLSGNSLSKKIVSHRLQVRILLKLLGLISVYTASVPRRLRFESTYHEYSPLYMILVGG